MDPYSCVLGILYLISEEWDGYSPSTDTSKKAVCELSTDSSLRAGTFSFFSHYFSLSLSVFISQVLALHQPPPPSLLPLSHSLLPSPLLSLSRTCVCSPSIIFSALFPEHSCMPETETKRLWYKPGCVGRDSYLHVGFNQFVFCSEREDRGY